MAEIDVAMSSLAVLLAKQDITEVLYRYCRALDTGSLELIRTCFHMDSTHDHGGFVGLSQDFCPIAIDYMKTLTAATHMVTNMTIEMEGMAAASECSFLSHQRQPTSSGEDDLLFIGRYRDRFEKREGVWKIAARVGTLDYKQKLPPSDTAIATLKAAS